MTSRAGLSRPEAGTISAAIAGQPRMGPDRRDERAERSGPRDLGGPAQDERQAPVEGLLDQGGLADPRVSGDEDEAAAPPAGSRSDGAKLPDLVLAADQPDDSHQASEG